MNNPSITPLTTSEDIAWAIEVHAKRAPQDRSFRYAILYGNEDFPDKIEFWRQACPRHDTAPDYVFPGYVLRDGALILVTETSGYKPFEHEEGIDETVFTVCTWSEVRAAMLDSGEFDETNIDAESMLLAAGQPVRAGGGAGALFIYRSIDPQDRC